MTHPIMPRIGTGPDHPLPFPAGLPWVLSTVPPQEPPVPRYRCLPAFAAMVLVPLPAFAADATRLPEPSGLFLLALGVTGVAIGRRFSSKRPD
ncbi:putative secreted protein with PEP-CTERM sorting signal [Novosphingobium sp. PhB55]|nr:putative secreted protein with PEP-CTERM sorting signal [Novosphingobium sp. PhB55]